MFRRHYCGAANVAADKRRLIAFTCAAHVSDVSVRPWRLADSCCFAAAIYRNGEEVRKREGSCHVWRALRRAGASPAVSAALTAQQLAAKVWGKCGAWWMCRRMQRRKLQLDAGNQFRPERRRRSLFGGGGRLRTWRMWRTCPPPAGGR